MVDIANFRFTDVADRSRNAYEDLNTVRQDIAGRRAGNALQQGDYRGAAGELYGAGMLDAGQELERRKATQDTNAAKSADERELALYKHTADVADRLYGVYSQFKGDPAKAQAELDRAFQMLAPSFERLGEKPEDIAQLREAMLSNPETNLQLLGATARKEAEAFTLTPGSKRYGADGKLIAEAPFAPFAPEVVKYQDGPSEAVAVVNRNGSQPGQGGGWLEAVASAAPNAVVTSGLRTPERNATVGGKPNSRHLDNNAVDLIPGPGETVAQLYARVSRVPGVRAIDEGDHVHVQSTTPRQGGGATVVARGAPKPADTAAAGKVEAASRKEFATLRKEFNQLPEVKNFKDVAQSYQQVRALAKPGATAADDIALTFSFMKMLDPGSVVREGEYALVGRAAGLPDQVIMGLNRIDEGKGLTPAIREKLVAAAAKIMVSRREQYDQVASQYRGLAQDAGIDPSKLAEAPGAWRSRVKQAPAAASSSAQIPADAIKALKRDPRLAGQFDAYYGKGESAKVLGK